MASRRRERWGLARTGLLALVLTAWGALPGAAPQGTAMAGDQAPTVVELFTSQSCYSCPPAEAYLGELAGRDDLVALEFHVDYWDDLVYGAAGRWKDRFSDPAYTRRQQVYAQRIPGGRVYTPQMVIDGRLEAVGSRRGAVQERIAQSRDERPAAPRLEVESHGGGLTVTLDGSGDGPGAEPLELWLVTFERAHVTEVEAGENKGKTLANHHVVTAMERIGSWSGGPFSLPLAERPAGANLGCAVLAQAPRQGPILAASYCPAAPGA